MKKLITSLFVGFPFFIGLSQNNQTSNVVKDTISTIESHLPVIVNASYKGGINNFYNYIGTNYNFNNIKSEDIIEEFKGKDMMTIYLQFVINEEGKPENFRPINTSKENTFYTEAVRVISSTRWNAATENDKKIKQEFRIPIQAYIRDL